MATMTVSKTVHRFGELPLPVYGMSLGITPAILSASDGGTFAPPSIATGGSATYTPANNRTILQTITLRDNNGAGAPVTVGLQMYGTAPSSPHYPIEGKEDPKKLTAPLADGSWKSRTKLRDPTKGVGTYTIRFDHRRTAEFLAWQTFWRWHSLQELAWYIDLKGDGVTFTKVRFDSTLNWNQNAGKVDFNVVITDAI